MNPKQLTLLIVTGAVLGGLGWVAWQKQKAPYEESTSEMGGKLLPDFPLNDVADVTIQEPASTLHLAKQDEIWVVKDRGGYPADFSKISDMLRKFWELKITKPVKIGPSRLPALELEIPVKGSAIQVEFKDKDAKPIASVVLGKQAMKDSTRIQQFGAGSYAAGRYVLVGSDIATAALVNEAFSTTEANPKTWLNKDWFKVEKLKSIAVTGTHQTNNWKLTRETEAATWTLADAKPGESLDTSKSSSVTSAFSYASFEDLATNSTPENTGMDKPIVGKLETFDGFTYTVKVGKTAGSDNNYYFQTAVAASFPAERTPGEDEKPEDKERLDKEFMDNLKKLGEKLKQEQAFAKWTYVVSKHTVDPILKQRQELLVEKKEEEASAATAPPAAPLTPTSPLTPTAPPAPPAPLAPPPPPQK